MDADADDPQLTEMQRLVDTLPWPPVPAAPGPEPEPEPQEDDAA